jgi:glucose/arabinose dehydrogenase
MKRQYGARVDVYRVVSSTTDHLTGEKTVVKEVFPVRKAPVLPYKIQRAVVQTISIISADKEFVYGGAFDSSKREIILDSRDLPNGFEIKPEDYVVFNHTRWDVVNVERVEYDTGWVIAVRNLPNMPPYEIRDILITQDLALADSAESLMNNEQAQRVLSTLGLAGTHTVVKTVDSLPVNSSSLNLQQTVVATVE